MTPAILVIDQGTTGTAAFLFDERGQIVASADQEFTQYFPRPGWVEHDAEEIWDSVLAVTSAVLQAAQGKVEPVAIGITNQRETTVVWDRATGRPIAHAIVWQCRRTAPMCEALRQRGLAADIQARTGLVLDDYFSGTKIRWLLENNPDALPRAERGELAAGTIDSWLLWNLTGGAIHATDPTNASRTMLYHIGDHQWDAQLCAELGVPITMLAEVRPSSGSFGTSAPRRFHGLSLPILGVAGDQQAALFGQACFAPGMAKNTYGTGCFLLTQTGDALVRSRNQLLTTVACGAHAARTYALEGSVFVAGAAVQWLRDGLGIIQTAAETEALALGVPDTNGVVFVPAFVGLGAPRWDMYARGLLIGITRGATRAHIARATLEAIALQTCDVLAAMQADGAGLQTLRVDGGGAVNTFLMQFQADVLGVPVERCAVHETTALGAAYLAGLAHGLWRDTAEIASLWRASARYEPAIGDDERGERRALWQRAVERAQHWEAE
jgi:glycerol kinase